jgi:F0F1-type ATP synthase membrane subunit c/vacuolar-type H+-ATPase subunit K
MPMLQPPLNPLLSGPVLASLGAVLAATLGALGAAIGIAYSGSAMIGTVAHKPATFSKAMISVVLAEALAIYGLLSAFMIIMRLSPSLTFSQGLTAIAAGLAIGLGSLGGGYGIAKAGSSMCTSIAEAPETFSKSLVSVVLAEALAIYGLLSSFMLIMRIDTVANEAQGVLAIAAALAVGLSTLAGGIGIASVGATLSETITKAPASFSKGLVSVVLAEALAIYGLLASFMLIMRIGPGLQYPAQGVLGVAAALGVGLATFAGGIGIARVGSVLNRTVAEAPATFSKGLVSVVLAEALAIYGLLAGFMLIMRIDTATQMAQGLTGIAAVLAIGIAALGAGLGIATAGATLCRGLARSPEAFSKGLVSVVLAEALAIYGLLASFMLIMRIDVVSLDAQAMMAIAAAVGVGMAAFGGGYGISKAGSALCRTIVEAPATFSKGLVAVVLAEALAIYGLLISFMVIMRVDSVTMVAQGLLAMSSSIAIGVAAIGGGLGIALSGEALCESLKTAPGTFSKSLVAVVLAEALAIYGLLTAFMLIMRIDIVTSESAALVGMAAALTVGVGGFCAGLAIGLAGRAMIRAMESQPGIFSKSMVPVVLAEALAIYTLLVAFMLIMRI